MKLGKKLNQIRKEKRITLKDLSKKSRVAIATLSKIETGLMTGTLESHTKICKALGIPLSELYQNLESESKVVHVNRKKDDRDSFMHADGARSEILTPKITDKKMLPTLIHLGKGAKTHSDENNPGSEKFIYVLKGLLAVEINKAEYLLATGDSIYFDSSTQYVLKNKGNEPVEAFCVLTPPQL